MSGFAPFLQPTLNSGHLYLGSHQLVVIAKPSPNRPYCRLASAFRSCCCSQGILNPCLNALRVLSDESNQIGILQELQFAAEYEAIGASMTLPADDFYQSTGQKQADCRFPYITATLISSMGTCCSDQEHADRHCALEASFHTVETPFRAAGNSLYEDCASEISVGVIDITDPRKPRYCFLDMDKKCIKCGLWWYGLVDDNIVQGLVPWDITDYTPLSCDDFLSVMAAEFEDTVRSQSKAQDVEGLDALRMYPVVDIAAIASCWPSMAWNSSGQLDAYTNQNPVSVYQETSRRGPRSLSELAQDKVLDAILSDLLDDLDLLNEPMLFRGFPKSFLAICAARVDELATSVHQETIAALLARLFEHADHVDLYPFRQLPFGTILKILQSDRPKNMKTLNLSGLFIGSPQDIWTALDAIPNKPALVYLLSPPSADKASEEAAVMTSLRMVRGPFWERSGSMEIILSASISDTLVSYCSIESSGNFGLKLTYLWYLCELVLRDKSRSQLLSHVRALQQPFHVFSHADTDRSQRVYSQIQQAASTTSSAQFAPYDRLQDT